MSKGNQEIKELRDKLNKIERSLELDRHNPKLLFEKGLILEKLGEYRSAYTAFSMAYTYDPTMVITQSHMIDLEPKLDEIRKKEYQEINRKFDEARRNKVRNHSNKHFSPWNIQSSASSSFSSSSSNKHFSSWNIFYNLRAIKRSIIIAIILTILLRFNMALIYNYNNGSLLFGQFGYVVDFIVVFFVSIIINWRNKWGDLICAFLISILIGILRFPKVSTTLIFIEILAMLFSICYVSMLIGNIIRHRKFNRTELFIAYTFMVLVIALLIVMIGSSVTNPSTVNFFNITISKITGYITGIASPKMNYELINRTWITQFFSIVNSYRSSNLSYCPTLSVFAEARYNTMLSNIQISHYGYNQTFDNFWPGGYTYGDLIYTGFGEEVLYPNEPSIIGSTVLQNYTPTNYIQNIIDNAPLHWQELISNDYSYYGYYVANGPAYDILGPNDGQSPCPITEIPGPNINITQYFEQYGCTTELGTGTWFVIELAPVCPT